jgi:hypothetical protein
LEVVNECQCGVERFDAGNLLYEALYRMRKVFQVMELYFPFIKGTVAERRHPATLANLKSGFLDICATKSGWILCGGQLPFPESAGLRPANEAMCLRKGTHRARRIQPPLSPPGYIAAFDPGIPDASAVAPVCIPSGV